MNTQEILELIDIKLEDFRRKREYAESVDQGQSMFFYYDGKIEALECLKEQIETAERNRRD